MRARLGAGACSARITPAATRSLGQGLSIAAGLALAARLDGLDKRVFCLVEDGESREGQIWEALDFIANYHFTAICPMFNCNGYGQSDSVSPQQSPEVTAAKLQGAGFDVQIIDEHSLTEIQQALTEHTAHSQNPAARPFAIVAGTIKGWWFPSIVGNNMHGQPVTIDVKHKALAALDATAQQVGAAWSEGDLRIPPMPTTAPPRVQPARPAPTFIAVLKQFGREKVLERVHLRRARHTAWHCRRWGMPTLAS